MRPETNKKTMAIYLLLTAAGFLGGILMMQFMGDICMETGGIFSYEWISRFLYMEIDCTGFFYYCFERRLLLTLVLFLAGISFLAEAFGGVSCFLLGLMNGMGLSIASAQLGIQGPLIYAATCFPQAFFYIPGFILYLIFILRFRQHKKTITVFLIILVLFTIGCFLESYVNPVVLHKILKKFY